MRGNWMRSIIAIAGTRQLPATGCSEPGPVPPGAGGMCRGISAFGTAQRLAANAPYIRYGCMEGGGVPPTATESVTLSPGENEADTSLRRPTETHRRRKSCAPPLIDVDTERRRHSAGPQNAVKHSRELVLETTVAYKCPLEGAA
ncbi:unnamed protein product, partial [Iphiclides podalirius]